ncbi:MAG: type IV toxin-antitoxin system AbiEi family antitoxin domain-containing protein [Actinomycetota bacterium]
MKLVYDAGITSRFVETKLATLSSTQHSVFSRGQAMSLGMTRNMIQHRLRAGRWEQVTRDVFRLAGAPPSWFQSLMTACLAWGDLAVVSHRAAAALWELAGFAARLVEITVPAALRRSAPGIVHRNALTAAETTRHRGIPVTRPARTLIDLASVTDRSLLEVALDDALRRRLVSLPQMRWMIERTEARRGARVMRSLLDERKGSAISESPLETRFLRLILEAGLPRPVSQYEVMLSNGRRARIDFAYPEHLVAIETDGYRWHSSRDDWETGLARRNELTLLGWQVIHVTPKQLEETPDRVLDAIRQALQARS